MKCLILLFKRNFKEEKYSSTGCASLKNNLATAFISVMKLNKAKPVVSEIIRLFWS